MRIDAQAAADTRGLQALADAKKEPRVQVLLGILDREGKSDPQVAATLARMLPMNQGPDLKPFRKQLEAYATGGTQLRYDSAAHQFIYNWQSPKKPGTCYTITIGLTDGTSHSATFQLK